METTAKKKKHIDDLHFEHQLWKSESKFYEDELKIYQGRLEEVASKNSKAEVRQQIEHFQNQFIIQCDQLDLVKNAIKLHESSLAKFAKDNPIAIDHKLFPDHQLMHDKMDTFKKLYAELKAEFNRFVATWL